MNWSELLDNGAVEQDCTSTIRRGSSCEYFNVCLYQYLLFFLHLQLDIYIVRYLNHPLQTRQISS